MGAVLIALAAAMLVFDQQFEPWFPFLLTFVVVLAVGATVELLDLLAPDRRPPRGLCLLAVPAVLLANWPAHVGFAPDPWRAVLGAFGAAVLATFLAEMATFREPGGSVVRIALAVWVVAYLGVLPSFLTQLRWLPGSPADAGGVQPGVAALALALFVPKFCDVGAYFTGRLLGRHRMTPVLSPKKTWEGLAGGLATAVLTTWLLNRLFPVLRGGDFATVGFGLTVGLAGVLGDLAESLVKRDCLAKDASQRVPGFGGVLDVVDSVVFAAPVAYWWLGG
jgi:phosphatidate cytidylyltransferase